MFLLRRTADGTFHVMPELDSIQDALKEYAKKHTKLKAAANYDVFEVELRKSDQVYDGWFVLWEDNVGDLIPTLKQMNTYLEAIEDSGKPSDIGKPTIYGLKRVGIPSILNEAPWLKK